MFDSLVEKVSLGRPNTYRNLTLTPILLKGSPFSSFESITLDEALAEGTTRVTEVSAEGHVPELHVRNFGDTPVLILDGEELVGAKQNRIVNLTILVPPQSEIVIPVTCIEAGRWSYSRPAFAVGGRVLNHQIRYSKAEAVTRSLKKRHVRFADQGAVWDGVSKALYALGAASPTSALSDGFESRANAINDYVAAFSVKPSQVGVIYRISGALAGLDLFGSEQTFARAFPKLVRGSALQALAGYEKNRAQVTAEEQLLSAALTASGDTYRAVGLGQEIRFDAETIGGGALQIDGDLVHLFAYLRAHGGVQ